MNYFQIVRQYNRFLLYALSHTFFSGLGQSIVVAFFLPYFREEFGLDNTAMGWFYSGATLTATLHLPYFGRKIDSVNLRYYSGAVGLTLALSCLILGLSPNLAVLFVGLTLLRLSGQSLMGHTASTTMARYFGKIRGKALGISSLGHPIGEAFFPILVTGLIPIIGWRMSYISLSVVIVLLFFPMTTLLVHKDDPFLYPSGRRKEDESSKQTHFTRRDVLKSPYFYCVMPLVILVPFLATGFFLNHANIADLKGWTMTWVATCLVGLSILRILGSVLVGPLIDKFTAIRLFPIHLIPMALGIGVLGLGNHPLCAFFYYSLFGLSLGLETNLKSALWAEAYGTEHLGGIRSMTLTFSIFSTAVSPVLFGWFFDQGVDLNLIVWVSVGLILGATILSAIAPHPQKQGQSAGGKGQSSKKYH